MGILKEIFKKLFGKSNKSSDVSGITETKMEVVHKKETANTIGGADDFFASKELLEKENKTDDKYVSHFIESNLDAQYVSHIDREGSTVTFVKSKSENSDSKKAKNKKNKKVVGQKTLSVIKEYIVTYGSIDVLTCEQKFKVKSLHNFIWYLRKEGFQIKTEKVVLHNEIGEKVEVTNYRLITKK